MRASHVWLPNVRFVIFVTKKTFPLLNLMQIMPRLRNILCAHPASSSNGRSATFDRYVRYQVTNDHLLLCHWNSSIIFRTGLRCLYPFSRIGIIPLSLELFLCPPPAQLHSREKASRPRELYRLPRPWYIPTESENSSVTSIWSFIIDKSFKAGKT